MSTKNFKIKSSDCVQLAPGLGACFVTDKITIEGMPVGFMYRETPDIDITVDSGWRFMSGTEDDDYMDDPDNSTICDVNTVANYDQAIIPYLAMPVGTELERVEGKDEFRIIEE